MRAALLLLALLAGCAGVRADIERLNEGLRHQAEYQELLGPCDECCYQCWEDEGGMRLYPPWPLRVHPHYLHDGGMKPKH